MQRCPVWEWLIKISSKSCSTSTPKCSKLCYWINGNLWTKTIVKCSFWFFIQFMDYFRLDFYLWFCFRVNGCSLIVDVGLIGIESIKQLLGCFGVSNETNVKINIKIKTWKQQDLANFVSTTHEMKKKKNRKEKNIKNDDAEAFAWWFQNMHVINNK